MNLLAYTSYSPIIAKYYEPASKDLEIQDIARQFAFQPQ